MKKIYSYILLLALATFTVGCEKELEDPQDQTKPDQEQPTPEPEPEPEPVVGEITLKGEASVVLSDEGGSQEVAFDATLEWTASASEEFVTVEPASGEAGEASVTVTVGVNESYDPRTATVTLTCGEDTKTIEVTQKQKGALLLTESTFTVAAEGQVITVLAKANSNVTYTIAEAAQSWITTAVAPNGLVDYSFNFEVAANEVEEARTGQIVFTNESGSETITIEQAAAEPKLTYHVISDAASLQDFATRVAAGETALEAQVTASFDASSLIWVPVENYTGIFDGNGQTITGLTQPLFGTLAGTVKNLTLESTINATATESLDWGIFAKVANAGTLLENCTANGSVTYTPAAALENDCHVAGIVGNYYGGTIRGCTNNATISFTSTGVQHSGYISVAGIVGRTQKEDGVDIVGEISDCTNKGSINYSAESTNTTHIAGIVGRVAMPLTNCHSSEGTINYNGTSYAGKLYIGGISGYVKEAVEISNCSSAMTINVGGAFEATNDNFFCAAGIISYANNNDLTISNCSNTGNINWSLETSTKGYTFIGGISGQCKGVISGCSNSGTITFTGKSTAQPLYIGGIAGTNTNVAGDRICGGTTNSGNIVINTSTQSGVNVLVGGIAGRSYGNVVATNSGKIDIAKLQCNQLYLGGIIGQCNGTISSGSKNLADGDISVAGLTVDDKLYLGGAVGLNSGNVTADNDGDVTLTDTCSSVKSIFVGGVVGRGEAPVTSCTNTGAVTNGCSMETSQSYLQLGGVVGYNNGDSPITSCHNTGAVTNTGNSEGFLYVGGITSECDADMENSTNTGVVTNSGESGGSYSSGKKCHNTSVGGVAGVNNGIIFTSCYNTGEVSNTAYAGGGIFVGGVVGKSSGGTYVTCYNTGAISNSGQAYDSLVACDVSIGGFAGYLVDGANTLTGTESAYNYNNGPVSETSKSTYIGVGGAVGFVNSANSELSYLKNLAEGKVTAATNTRDRIWAGGTVGAANQIFTMDYASNAAEVYMSELTIKQYVVIGGVVGGFCFANKDIQEAELTFTGLTNSGKVNCPDVENSANMAAASSSTKGYSYFGGISGVGDAYEKHFYNCTNTGEVSIYNQLKTRLGGVLGYTNINPTGCVNKGNIRYYRRKGAYTEGNGEIGGVVGYMNVETVENLTNDADVNSNSSSPNCATGGIIGLVGDSTIAFKNCKCGSTNILGSSKGQWVHNGNGGSGVFCSDKNANAFDFTGCVIKKGTMCQGMEVTDENLESAIVGRRLPTEITNAPTFVDSF